MPNISEQLGAKLGPRLAALMSQATADTHRRLTPLKVAGNMQFQEQFFALVGSETKRTTGILSRELAAIPDIEPWLRETFAFMGNETGQWSALLNFAAYGSGLSGGLTGIITNEIAPLVQLRYRAQPNAVHSPTTLAQLVVSEGITQTEGENEALKSALGRIRFNQLVFLARQTPPFEVLSSLHNRGTITTADVRTMLRKQGFSADWAKQISTLTEAELSPEEAANLVDRGEVTASGGRTIAARSGVRPEDFDRMVTLVGVPPAAELLMMARRRGIIDDARLAKGIRQSPLRTEWTDVVTALQYDPLSTEQAASAVMQNLMSVTEGRKIANENGMRAADFDRLVEAAGRPPGVQEVLDLWNRGEVSEAEVKQALLESTLKNKWVPLIMKTRRRVPPQDTVRMLINRGVLTPAQGVKRFMAVGYSADDAAALAELAQKDKTSADRSLTKAEVVSLYEFRLVTDVQARKMLDDLGYDANEQGFLLALADFRKAKREMDAGASVIRSKYVAHKISDAECSNLLDALHVPSDARDHLMQIWSLERDANQRELTPAQVIAALKDSFISRDDAQARLTQQGYSAGDADLLISHAIGRS